jgi:hypothetical protein
MTKKRTPYVEYMGSEGPTVLERKTERKWQHSRLYGRQKGTVKRILSKDDWKVWLDSSGYAERHACSPCVWRPAILKIWGRY